jgi:hypothetical protein
LKTPKKLAHAPGLVVRRGWARFARHGSIVDELAGSRDRRFD